MVLNRRAYDPIHADVQLTGTTLSNAGLRAPRTAHAPEVPARIRRWQPSDHAHVPTAVLVYFTAHQYKVDDS